MNQLITQLCALRNYQPHPTEKGLYMAPCGAHVYFYFTEVLTQEFVGTVLARLAPEARAILLCHKQKKMRLSLDLMPHITIFQIQTLRHLLIPNKFCPRFERLAGDELACLQRHEAQLPVLLASDPMAQLYGFHVGDIVKIYRLDGSLYFRKVC